MTSLFRQTVTPHRYRRSLNGSPGSEPPVLETGGDTTGRVLAIDGMRAMAMLMVYVYHTWEFGDAPALRVAGLSFGSIINGFSSGVDLFIVLSGFCLFWPLAKKPASVEKWTASDFAIRRIRRILPAYLGSMVFVTLLPNFLVCIFKLMRVPAKWQQFPPIWQYLTHLTFTHTLFPRTWDGIQGVYWSLGLEAQLYLVFPLVIMGFRRIGMPVLIPMLVSSLVYRAIGAVVLKDAGWTANFLFSITFLGRWMEFAAGMLAAWIVVKRRSAPLSGLQGWLICVASVLGYSLAVSHWVPDFAIFPLREVLFSLSFSGAAIAMCASRTKLRMILENRVMAFLGLISYSIFLLHQNMMFYFGELLKKVLGLGGGTRFAILITAGFVLTVMISYAFYLVLERPWASVRAKSPSVKDPGSRSISPKPGEIQNNFQARNAVA